MQLGCLEYSGESCGFMVAAKSSFPGISGHRGNGYIVITPKDTQGTGAAASVALGPVTEHFANQATNGGDSIIYGLSHTFEQVPAGDLYLCVSSSVASSVSFILASLSSDILTLPLLPCLCCPASLCQSGYQLETLLAASTVDDPPSKAPERASVAAGGVNDALFQVLLGAASYLLPGIVKILFPC